MEWISIKDALPEEGAHCWTLEQTGGYTDGRWFPHLQMGVRRFNSRKKDGQPTKHPWSKSGMFYRRIVYWIAIPKYPEMIKKEMEQSFRFLIREEIHTIPFILSARAPSEDDIHPKGTTWLHGNERYVAKEVKAVWEKI